jgi:hypothetical protein
MIVAVSDDPGTQLYTVLGIQGTLADLGYYEGGQLLRAGKMDVGTCRRPSRAQLATTSARTMRAVNSEAQQAAARENGRKGGRPNQGKTPRFNKTETRLLLEGLRNNGVLETEHGYRASRRGSSYGARESAAAGNLIARGLLEHAHAESSTLGTARSHGSWHVWVNRYRLTPEGMEVARTLRRPTTVEE